MKAPTRTERAQEGARELVRTMFRAVMDTEARGVRLAYLRRNLMQRLADQSPPNYFAFRLLYEGEADQLKTINSHYQQMLDDPEFKGLIKINWEPQQTISYTGPVGRCSVENVQRFRAARQTKLRLVRNAAAQAFSEHPEELVELLATNPMLRHAVQKALTPPPNPRR
jgi:hypothetical protein